MKYILITLLISTLTACSFKDNVAIREVEKLQAKVTTLQEQFNSVDIEAVKEAKKQYDESMFLIKKYYFKDTIDVLFMNSLDYYKNVKYASKVINKNKAIIGTNFEITEKQLSVLKEDLNNTAIEGDKLKEALANENKNVMLLDSTVSLYVSNVKILLNVHDSIAGYVKNKTLTF